MRYGWDDNNIYITYFVVNIVCFYFTWGFALNSLYLSMDHQSRKIIFIIIKELSKIVFGLKVFVK